MLIVLRLPNIIFLFEFLRSMVFTTASVPLQGDRNLRRKDVTALLGAICSKTYPSFLTVKEGSTSHLGLLPSGKKRKPLLSIVFTTPSVPLVGDRNVALNHFILWLADHQRSTPAAELRFFVRDKPQGHGGVLLMRLQGHGDCC